jgi:hypothetical protein
VVLTNSVTSPAVTFGNVKVDDSGSYDVVVTNQYGKATGAVVNITVTAVPPPSAAQLSAQFISGNLEIECAGTPGANYTLWRALGLDPASWTSVAAGTPDLGGKIVLIDTSPPPAGAFYRASSP